MPGITGIIHSSPDLAADLQVREMVSRLRHETQWHSGEIEIEPLKVAAGWVARPHTFADCMPVWNEERTVCLLFAGEEFSIHNDLIGLARQGHLEVGDQAGALVHLYEELGPEFFRRLNGWFSGLLIDLRNETTTLFNDRYGLSRLYYHQGSAGFHFASEAKSLWSVLPRTREMDQRGLAEYFSMGCVLQNRSLFRDIHLLPPGSAWTFHRDGRVEKRRYFNPETWEQQETLTSQQYSNRLREVVGRVAPRYLGGGQPVAMSLTGGLDSRMILAWAKAAPGTLPSYTFGGPYRDCADVRIARELARTCSQPHTTLHTGEDFFGNFTELARQTVHLTDGAMDVSGAVELHVNRRAREIAPVRLTGNYGSEILRANVAFRPGRMYAGLFTPEFQQLLLEAEVTYREESIGHRLSFIAFKQVPWHHYSRLSLEQSQLTVRSPFLDNELVALAYQAPPDLATSPLPLLQLIAEGNPALETVPTDRALQRHPATILSKLGNGFQEFTARAEYAYDYGMPDWLVLTDRAFRALHFEKLFLGRHKFYHFRVWYRDQLAASVKEILLDGRALAGSHVNSRSVQQRVQGHLDGRCNFTLGIHKILGAELLQRMLIEQCQAAAMQSN